MCQQRPELQTNIAGDIHESGQATAGMGGGSKILRDFGSYLTWMVAPRPISSVAHIRGGIHSIITGDQGLHAIGEGGSVGPVADLACAMLMARRRALRQRVGPGKG